MPIRAPSSIVTVHGCGCEVILIRAFATTPHEVTACGVKPTPAEPFRGVEAAETPGTSVAVATRTVTALASRPKAEPRASFMPGFSHDHVRQGARAAGARNVTQSLDRHPGIARQSRVDGSELT
jgi:hypothetical protein